jgi:hypothetical protein
MWKVFLSNTVHESIVTYTDKYLSYLSDPFVDTGIWSESIIREQYVRSAKTLYDNLQDGIISRLEKNILPYEWIDEVTGLKRSCIFIGKRALFLEYTEDPHEKVRYISYVRIIYQ